jgi:hypothetical protein
MATKIFSASLDPTDWPEQPRERAAYLEKLLDRVICVGCDSTPRAVWMGMLSGESNYGLKCNCWPKPAMIVRQSHRVDLSAARRHGEMMGDYMQEQTGMDPNTALAVPQATDIASKAAPPMTVEEFRARQELIRAVVGEMKLDIHYGHIPGTSGNARSLWEPGAEYLRAAFRVAWSYTILESFEDRETDTYRYKIQAFALNPDGSSYASWVGSASSRERKFFCRARTCGQTCNQQHPPAMEAEMLPHNVLDRAIKRSFVALIRNVTGTSGDFQTVMDEEEDVAGAASTNGARATAAAHQGAYSNAEIRDGCPKHNKPWEQGTYGPYHKMPRGEDLCSLTKILTAFIQEAGSKQDLTVVQINDWLKRAEGFGETLSKLDTDKKITLWRMLLQGPLSTPDAEPEPSAEENPAAGLYDESPSSDDEQPVDNEQASFGQ